MDAIEASATMGRAEKQEIYRFPPGPRGLPLVGNFLQFRRDQLTFFEGVQRAFGSLATIHFFKVPLVVTFRPEHAYDILVEHARIMSVGDRPELRERLGEALLTTDGATHRRQRRLVQPAFHRKRVEGYAEVMTSQTIEMVRRWHIGDELDFTTELRELTLRIIVKALFDLDLAETGNRLSQIFRAVVEGSRPGFADFLPASLLHLVPDPSREPALELDKFLYQLIAERRAIGGDHGDVLSMLLEARDEEGQPLSDLEIRDQALTLIAAGHETTFTALSWALDLLTQHPNAYASLRHEVATILAGETPTAADVARLPYLDAVILESLRMRPPAWMVNRVTLEPFALDDYYFPAGTPLFVSPWVLHHSPELWGDPEAFRPERWLDGTARSLPRGSYIPFGMGPRMCIGMPLAEMEMRLVLATILQYVTPTVVPGFRPVARPRVTLRLATGLPVRIGAPETLHQAATR